MVESVTDSTVAEQETLSPNVLDATARGAIMRGPLAAISCNCQELRIDLDARAEG
jgi:hypothetical protein